MRGLPFSRPSDPTRANFRFRSCALSVYRGVNWGLCVAGWLVDTKGAALVIPLLPPRAREQGGWSVSLLTG
ncbi:hypothetical protein TUM20249_61340 [Pseudomonas tohonis]|nr:hypothetical protein TUM20249_61340 [Pseudomonas tohonis]